MRLLREELHHLQEPGSYVGEVIKQMGQKKVLVKVNPEGKYVVTVDDGIDITDLKPNTRVALRNDSYQLHRILPTKVDPLVSLMKVEAVPDSTYDMIGGLEKQVMEIKEVIELPIKHPELFDALGVAQPKVGAIKRARSAWNLCYKACRFAPRRLGPSSLTHTHTSGRPTLRPPRNRQNPPRPCRRPPH